MVVFLIFFDKWVKQQIFEWLYFDLILGLKTKRSKESSGDLSPSLAKCKENTEIFLGWKVPLKSSVFSSSYGSYFIFLKFCKTVPGTVTTWFPKVLEVTKHQFLDFRNMDRLQFIRFNCSLTDNFIFSLILIFNKAVAWHISNFWGNVIYVLLHSRLSFR